MASWLEVIFGFLFLLLLFNQFSSTAKFFTRLSCYYLALIIAPCLSIPPAFLRLGNPGNLLYPSWYCRYIFYWIFGLNWVVVNQEHIMREDACIYVANHQSSLDIMGMMNVWPLFHPCVPVMKKELLRSGPFGVICWMAGSVFVDRFNSKESKEILNRKVNELKDRKISIWIFPEGTRNSGKTLLPFKKGAFHMAVLAQLPLVPVVFSSYSTFYSPSKKLFNGGDVFITVLPPVSTKGMTAENVPALVDEIRESMQQCFTSSNNCSNEPITATQAS